MEDQLKINARPFRIYFILVQTVNIVLSLTTLLIIKVIPEFFWVKTLDKKFIGIAMLVLLVTAIAFTTIQNKRLSKIQKLDETELKISTYFKIYKARLLWFLFSCITVSLLGVLTNRIIFFYFAVVDVLMAMPYYPTSLMFRRELKNDAIELL